MVNLFHVPLFVSVRIFGCAIHLQLLGSIIHRLSSFAKTLERKATFQHTDCSFFDKWSHNSSVFHPLGERSQSMWPSSVGGLVAMLASLYFLSQGWAMATYSPFSSGVNLDSDAQKEKVLGMREMAVPMLAGILSAFRRVIARRISIKNQLKRRLHAITIASATCFMFPVAMWDVILGTAPDSNKDLPFSTWPYISTILFGVILISYVENIAEERLHMVFSSPKHLMVAGGCIIVLEILYKMDFSLAGFIICCALLGFGIYEATSLERPRRDHQTLEPSENLFEEDQIQMSSLPT